MTSIHWYLPCVEVEGRECAIPVTDVGNVVVVVVCLLFVVCLLVVSERAQTATTPSPGPLPMLVKKSEWIADLTACGQKYSIGWCGFLVSRPQTYKDCQDVIKGSDDFAFYPRKISKSEGWVQCIDSVLKSVCPPASPSWSPSLTHS